MKAYMSCLVRNYTELMKYIKNQQEITPMEVEVIGVICLEKKEWLNFASDFKRDQEWLLPFLKDMSSVERGVWKCVKIVQISLNIEIVVYSNRCMYPQYVGIQKRETK